MYFDFCVASSDAIHHQKLNTIFRIAGDRTYSIPRKEITVGKTYFVYTTSGEGEIAFDDVRFTISRSEGIFIRPTKNFRYHCSGDFWHFWWFETMGDSQHFPINEKFPIIVGDFKDDLFTQSLSYAKQGRWDIANKLFDVSCDIMYQNILAEYNEQKLSMITTADQYVRENLATVTVADLCDALQIKERTLRNQFYQIWGHGPKCFIANIRLSAAQQMLETTTMTVADISTQLGYSSQFYFSRTFRQKYGLSPQQYRNQIRK